MCARVNVIKQLVGVLQSTAVQGISPLSVGVCPWLSEQNWHWQNLRLNGVCRLLWEREGEKPPLLFDYSVALTHGMKLAGRCQDLFCLQAPTPDGQKTQRHM